MKWTHQIWVFLLLGAVLVLAIFIMLRRPGEKGGLPGSDVLSGHAELESFKPRSDAEPPPEATGKSADQPTTLLSRSERSDAYSILFTLTGDAASGDCLGQIKVFDVTNLEVGSKPIVVETVIGKTGLISVSGKYEKVLLVAAIRGYFTEWQVLNLDELHERITIPLEIAESIFCTVVTESMQPIGDALVRCGTASLGGESIGLLERALAHHAGSEGITNALGQVQFDVYPRGQIRLHAYPPAPLAESILWDCVPGVSQLLICRTAVELHGHVQDLNGEPISDVNVAAYGPFRLGGEVPLAATRTDQNGNFKLASVPDGPEYIRCFAEKVGWSLGHQVLPKRQSLRESPISFVLAPALGLKIAVQAWDGAPVSGLRLRLVGESGAGVPFVYDTNESGVATVGDYVVAARRYQVLGVVGSSEVILGEFITPSRSEWPVEPILFTARELGRVTIDPIESQKVESLELEWIEGGAPRLAIIERPSSSIYLPARKYFVGARTGARVYHSELVVVPAKEARLAWPAIGTQRLLVASTSPDTCWPVVSIYTDGNILIDQIDTSTEEVFCALASGRYYFSLDYHGTVIDSVIHDVPLHDSVIDLRHLVKPSRGRIQGRVVSEDGIGIPGVVVAATSRDGYRLPSAHTASAGEFTISSVPFGKYWVAADIADLVGAAGCRLAKVVYVGSPESEQYVEIELLSEDLVVDFRELPGIHLEGLVCSSQGAVNAMLLPGGVLSAPAQAEAEWAVVASRDERESIHIGGVHLTGSLSHNRYSYDHGAVRTASFIHAPDDKCLSVDLRFRVQGHPLGVSARLDSSERTDIQWTTALEITLEVLHFNGKRELIKMQHAGERELRCDDLAKTIAVDFSPTEVVRAVDLWIECCGVRTSIDSRCSVGLSCDAVEHLAVVSGHGIFHSLLTVQSGDVIRPRGLSGTVSLSSPERWQLVEVVAADDPAESFRLEASASGLWIGRGLPAEDFLIMATSISGIRSLRGRFSAPPSIDVELEFD